MHEVTKDFKLILGPFEITTGDEFSAEASTPAQGPDPAVKVRNYWFKSPVGVIRYYSPDHSKVLWEGHYKGRLKLSAVLSEGSDGKAQVTIPVGSLWLSSISIDNPPEVEPVIGSTISIPKLEAGAWNAEEIQAQYTARHEVESQTGTLRFVSLQSFALPAAKLSMPLCDLADNVNFNSVPQSETSFDFHLGQASIILNKGRFTAAAIKKQERSQLNCQSFHSAIESFDTSALTADISPAEVKLKTSIPRATGLFLGTRMFPSTPRNSLKTNTSLECEDGTLPLS
jgi:hypothetical protein